MSASGIRMGKVYVEIGADQKALNKALNNIKKQVAGVGKSLQTLGSRMAVAGASAVTAFVGATKVFADAGDALRDMSMRTGASVEALSSLGYVAAQSGANLETLEAGMRRMQKVVAAARDGNKAAATAFSQLGISLEELNQLSPDQQMLLIGDALASIPDPADRAAAAMKIFGKGGTALLPMLSEGSARIKEMQAEAERLGVVMSTEDANAADEFNDSLARLSSVAKGGANAIGAALAPAMTQLANTLSEVVGRAVRFVRENQGLVRTALAAAGALAVAGTATWAIGTAMVAASNSFSAAARAADMLLGPARLLSNIGTAVGQSFLIAASGVAKFGISAAISLAGILGPIGLIGVAVAGIGAAVLAQQGAFNVLGAVARNVFQQMGGFAGQVGGWMVKAFSSFLDDAIKVFSDLGRIASITFQGVADALVVGDISGAAEMLWLGVLAAWQRGSAAVMNYMDGWITDIQNTWSTLWVDMAGIADKGWSLTLVGFNDMAHGLTLAVDTLAIVVATSFDYLVGNIQKSWNYIQSLFKEGFDLEAENKKVDNANAARMRDRTLRSGVVGHEAAMREYENKVQAGMQARKDERERQRDQVIAGRARENANRARERQAGVDETMRQMQGKADELKGNRADFEAAELERRKLRGQLDPFRLAGGAAGNKNQSEVIGSFSASTVGQLSFGKSLAQRQVELLGRIANGVERMGEEGEIQE